MCINYIYFFCVIFINKMMLVIGYHRYTSFCRIEKKRRGGVIPRVVETSGDKEIIGGVDETIFSKVKH